MNSSATLTINSVIRVFFLFVFSASLSMASCLSLNQTKMVHDRIKGLTKDPCMRISILKLLFYFLNHAVLKRSIILLMLPCLS